MNIKSVLYGSFISFTAFVITGFVWHSLVFPEWYISLEYIGRAEMLPLFLIIGELFRALLMAIIYPFGYQGTSAMEEGLRFGLIMNIFLGSVWICWVYALHSITGFWFFLILEGLHIILSGCLAGSLISYIYNKTKYTY